MSLRLDRALIRISGPDARTFLNNLLTRDVAQADGELDVVYAALLSPQGKVVADFFVWNDSGDGSVLDADPSRAADLQRRLALYKLRAQVTIENITGQFHILYAPEFFRGSRKDPRFLDGALGWRELCPLPPEQYSFQDGGAAYDAHRIAAGVPDLARDAQPEEVFAGEALLEELNGVAFDKGCFVGQENVSRMKRRATTRKKFCPVVFDGDRMAYGTPVLAGEAEIGTVRTGVAGRAIALLRLDRALDAAASDKPLTAGGREIRLDPPAWLILPQGEEAPG
jgi:folate-binding protein YgfZ